MNSRRQVSVRLVAGLLLVLGGIPRVCVGQAPAPTEPERYALQGCVLEIGAPVEVGRAEGHFWFSSLHPVHKADAASDRDLASDNVLCEVVLADDKAQGKWPATLCLSRDGGASWKRIRDIESYGPISTPLGPGKILIMPYETGPVSPTDKRNAVADGTIVTLSQDGSLTTERAPVKYLNFPRDLADYYVGELYLLTNGNILPLKDGAAGRRLFATVYGHFAGETKDSTWSVTSDDGAFTWKFQAAVANGPALGTPEGANESNTARLVDGRLMCVYRTGADYYKSYSGDEGATWTPPERMEGVFRVEPQIVRLANGVMLLSGGRQGLFVWACTDGEGKKWDRFNLGEHHNKHVQDKALHYTEAFCKGEGVDPAQSTSYTGMAAVGPDDVLVCYDRLANGWKGAPGPYGPCDAVFCVRIKATPNPQR